MDTLIELVLLAAAAYGVKSYFLTPEPLVEREIFPTRGATFVKRLVQQQYPRTGADVDSPAIPEQPVTGQSFDSQPVATSLLEDVETADAGAPAITDQAAGTPAIEEPQPKQSEANMPEDSMLKRHYLGLVAAELASIQNPYPTDSVLRRHANQIQEVLLIAARSGLADVVDDGARSTITGQSAEIVAETMAIPEDSMLKRHYNQLLQAKTLDLSV